jgi:hypothetical protein
MKYCLSLSRGYVEQNADRSRSHPPIPSRGMVMAFVHSDFLFCGEVSQ